ncbi:unnamed protein product [Parnassius mnemosyne]|uniref:BZIP domain-containing protein n=1 Tax=Parnassius mnemosyne TaxID=213953 RepID=A0AAV1M6H2_9NEOP
MLKFHKALYPTMGRPTKNAARMRKRYLEESNNEKNKSLEANRKRIRLTRSQECLNQREERLSKMRS